MVLQCVVACVLVILGMMSTFGMVRFLADVLIFLIGVGAFATTLYCILDGQWQGWIPIAAGSFGTGAAAALLSLPAAPFSSLWRKRR